MDYNSKYLKYKAKYLKLKNSIQIGGVFNGFTHEEIVNKLKYKPSKVLIFSTNVPTKQLPTSFEMEYSGGYKKKMEKICDLYDIFSSYVILKINDGLVQEIDVNNSSINHDDLVNYVFEFKTESRQNAENIINKIKNGTKKYLLIRDGTFGYAITSWNGREFVHYKLNKIDKCYLYNNNELRIKNATYLKHLKNVYDDERLFATIKYYENKGIAVEYIFCTDSKDEIHKSFSSLDSNSIVVLIGSQHSHYSLSFTASIMHTSTDDNILCEDGTIIKNEYLNAETLINYLKMIPGDELNKKCILNFAFVAIEFFSPYIDNIKKLLSDNNLNFIIIENKHEKIVKNEMIFTSTSLHNFYIKNYNRIMKDKLNENYNNILCDSEIFYQTNPTEYRENELLTFVNSSELFSI